MSCKRIFEFNTSLTTIYASDEFVIPYSANGEDMFMGCDSLVGEKGTTYRSNLDISKYGKAYARIDDAPDRPGYFTRK